MKIYIGFDARELSAYLVAVNSLRRQLSQDVPVYALELSTLQQRGLYKRPTEYRNGLLYDVISEHPMSTEFAVSRFLVPYLAETGWALFADGDILVLDDLLSLYAYADPKYAVLCVKHEYAPTSWIKMDSQVQSNYPRKNWSSVCLWNCDHPAVKQIMTPDFVNSATGRVLHSFEYFTDDEIGELPIEYNYLVGVTNGDITPKIVHFTEGTPHMRGYEFCEYAREWRAELGLVVPGILSGLSTLPA